MVCLWLMEKVVYSTAKGIFFAFPSLYLVTSTGVSRTKKVPNKYLLNEWVNEWMVCNAQCFSPFLRSISLLSTRRCGSWHRDREGEGQWPRYWWKCTVLIWHHWWRWNSTFWNHFRCPGPGWRYKTKKGKPSFCSSSAYLFETWDMKLAEVGWISWHNLRANRGLASFAVKKEGPSCTSYSLASLYISAKALVQLPW